MSALPSKADIGRRHWHVRKGGTGPEQRIDYATYLARSAKLFLQAMTLLRIEIMMCHATGARPPLA
jgi:hypothetical protein